MSFDCTKCGACCVNDSGAGSDTPWIPVTSAERRRLPAHSRKLAVLNRPWSGDYAIQTKHNADGDCVCACLEGSVGTSVRCAIYEQRPSLCREFSPGGWGCLEARRDHFDELVK